MREQEMRMRVCLFLKARLRNMIMPATVGIGLAVGGCAKEGLSTADSAAARDSTAPLEEVAPQLPDGPASGPEIASSDSREAQAARDVPSPDATDSLAPNPDVLATDGSPRDLAADSPGRTDLPVAIDGSGPDRGPDLIFVKYGVPFPDASVDTPAANPDTARDAATVPDGPAVRYAAVMPDSGRDIMLTLYAAPQPS